MGSHVQFKEHLAKQILYNILLPYGQKLLLTEYTYNEEGLQRFKALCNSEHYHIAKTEVKILSQNVKEIVTRINQDSVSVVDLGSG